MKPKNKTLVTNTFFALSVITNAVLLTKQIKGVEDESAEITLGKIPQFSESNSAKDSKINTLEDRIVDLSDSSEAKIWYETTFANYKTTKQAT